MASLVVNPSGPSWRCNGLLLQLVLGLCFLFSSKNMVHVSNSAFVISIREIISSLFLEERVWEFFFSEIDFFYYTEETHVHTCDVSAFLTHN